MTIHNSIANHVKTYCNDIPANDCAFAGLDCPAKRRRRICLGYGQCDTSALKNIVALSAGNDDPIFLRADGSVTAPGHNGFGKTDMDDWNLFR